LLGGHSAVNRLFGSQGQFRRDLLFGSPQDERPHRAGEHLE